MRKIASLTVLLLISCHLLANDYDKAWEALSRNDRAQAMTYLESAMADPRTSVDATITYIYLQTFNGKEHGDKQFYEKAPAWPADINPYLFALWFNESVLGDYGKKTDINQLNLLQQIFTRNDINGSIKTAAHYVIGMHYLKSNQWAKAKAEWEQMNSVENWQLVGPFENLSGSGFNKSYGPVDHPDSNSEFRSTTNAAIKWFVPSYVNEHGWKLLQSHILPTTAISYAQTFVYAPSEMDVYINAGVSGSVKVWVNDALKIAEMYERVTELDSYRSACHLHKGYNRILVQLGYTDNATPNFIIRLTDDKGMALPGLTSSGSYQKYTKDIAPAGLQPLRHFAETYFEEKIRKEPDNLVNYILLSQTFLRNKKTFDARKIIEASLKKSPGNSLLHFELLQCLLKEGNRTLLSQEIEWLKENDPDCLISYTLRTSNLMDEEKYEEATEMINKNISAYGENETIIQDKIKIAFAQNRRDDALKMVQEAYAKYPDNIDFVATMFDIKKNADKDAEAAIAVYEKFLENNYDFQVLKNLGEEYIEQGKKEKGIAIMNHIHDLFPFDGEYITNMVRFYFDQQDYKKALEYADQVLKLAPYCATYWNNKAIILEQAGKTEEAAADYKRAIYYDPQQYDSRKKLRVLEKKKDLYKAFPETDVYDIIKKSANKTISTDYNYSYLLDEKQVIMYGEGATEEYRTYAIRMNTTAGIDHWKDSYIPYNQYTQVLLIEKAEVVKKNGSKLTAEKNDNEMVFTSLETGDVILIKYRLQNYARGRLGKEFFDHYNFDSFTPSGEMRYCFLVPAKLAFDYKMTGAGPKPKISEVEEYKLYTWELNEPALTKDEPYMPSLNDVGAALHISTIKSWNDIANWYSDISNTQTADDFELKEVYNNLFPGKETITDFDKAKRIYNYIEKNIRYSSVPFRQSAYVPQQTSVTLNTRLGDCKDLSSLFVSLATMAGLDAKMVLVETRDNGTSEMLLPSVQFNHCIALLKAAGKEYYIELTDNDLPFGSLPYQVPGSSSLIIPGQTSAGMTAELKPIVSPTRTPDVIRRTINLSADGSDLNVQASVERTGALTSFIRSDYADLTPEKRMEELEKSIGGGFKNPVKMNTASFSGLDSLGSVRNDYSYTVKNEVVEVADMKMFKIPYGDVIATIDNFTKDTRKYALEYWRYETVDNYETVINIKIPAGKKLVELPKNREFTFNKNVYSIKYQVKPDGKLIVTRKASLNRDNISPADYPAFKAFLNNIIEVESKYIAFKS